MYLLFIGRKMCCSWQLVSKQYFLKIILFHGWITRSDKLVIFTSYLLKYILWIIAFNSKTGVEFWGHIHWNYTKRAWQIVRYSCNNLFTSLYCFLHFFIGLKVICTFLIHTLRSIMSREFVIAFFIRVITLLFFSTLFRVFVYWLCNIRNVCAVIGL